jgi:hypothetical protein
MLQHLLEFGLSGMVFMLAAFPASTDYKLHNYGFTSGGLNNASSANYSANASSGEISGQTAASAAYQQKSGHNETQQSNVPPAPTFTNPASYYNKLHFVIATASNPSDAKFAIAISSDNFATTNYIHNDNTFSSVFNPATDYQTYASWGGATGQDVLGLQPNTPYKIKVKATTGNFTETQFGPTASASTVPASITFDIDVSASNTETSPPYATSFGNLLPATVTTTPEKIWIDLDTNANSGAKVYIASSAAGLFSSAASFTITSATADLAGVSTGYGAQSQSTAQGSGGPLAATTPFNGAAANVGVVSTVLRELFDSPAPITGGRGSFYMKAKAANTTPASANYTDTLTLVSAAAF